MRSINLLVLLIVLPFIAKAAEKKMRIHEAHVHGAATLNVVFDNLQGEVEFKAAAEGILGFEHEARSEHDKKAFGEVLAQFENISEMIKIDPAKKCVFSKKNIGLTDEDKSHRENKKEHQAEHANFQANYGIRCQSSIIGSNLIIDFSKFPKLNDVDVSIVVGNLQKSAEAKKRPITIELK